MNEYEFRLVVYHHQPFTLEEFSVETQIVSYAEPHFRYKRRCLETKVVQSTEAVYYDSLWFRWVHSVETPFRQWSKATHGKFLDKIQNFSSPFSTEKRQYVKLDDRAQMYTFQHPDGTYRLVFEWEYGTFDKPLTIPIEGLLTHLKRYGKVFDRFRAFKAPRMC